MMNPSLQLSKNLIDQMRTDFLIITALPEERDAVLQYFKPERPAEAPTTALNLSLLYCEVGARTMIILWRFQEN